MKFSCALLCCFACCFSFGQTLKFDSEYKNRTLTSQERDSQALCSQNNPSNNFETALFTGNLNGQIVANDFSIDPDTTFSLEQIKANLWSIEGLDAVDVYLLFSSEGSPNGVALMELNLTPTAQIELGTSQGYNVYETVLDLPTPFVLEGGSEGATFWIMLVGYATSGNSDPVLWEATSASSMGNLLAFNNSTDWEISTTLDGVYEFIGDCSPTLGVNNNELSNITIWPIPANDKLNISLSTGAKIDFINLFDVSGKKQRVVLSEGTIDISHLASGSYFLTLETKEAKAVKRFIKN